MDREGIIRAAAALFRQYRWAVLLAVLGLALLLIPSGSGEQTAAQAPLPREESLEDRLASILSKVKGAGKVEVLLTLERGEETLYQTDTDSSDTGSRADTVTVTGSDRQEQGLVRQTLAPEYLGAVVVCQGGADPNVRLAVVEAVMDATGLGAHQITVLKMK